MSQDRAEVASKPRRSSERRRASIGGNSDTHMSSSTSTSSIVRTSGARRNSGYNCSIGVNSGNANTTSSPNVVPSSGSSSNAFNSTTSSTVSTVTSSCNSISSSGNNWSGSARRSSTSARDGAHNTAISIASGATASTVAVGSPAQTTNLQAGPKNFVSNMHNTPPRGNASRKNTPGQSSGNSGGSARPRRQSRSDSSATGGNVSNSNNSDFSSNPNTNASHNNNSSRRGSRQREEKHTSNLRGDEAAARHSSASPPKKFLPGFSPPPKLTSSVFDPPVLVPPAQRLSAPKREASGGNSEETKKVVLFQARVAKLRVERDSGSLRSLGDLLIDIKQGFSFPLQRNPGALFVELLLSVCDLVACSFLMVVDPETTETAQHTWASFSHLVSVLALSKQISNPSDEKTIRILVKTLLEIHAKSTQWVQLECLRALSHVLFEHSPLLVPLHDTLLALLLPLCKSPNVNTVKQTCTSSASSSASRAFNFAPLTSASTSSSSSTPLSSQPTNSASTTPASTTKFSPTASSFSSTLPSTSTSAVTFHLAAPSTPSNTNSRVDRYQLELRRAAISCVGNMCIKSGPELRSRSSDISWALLQAIKSCSQDQRQDGTFAGTLAATLRAIKNAVADQFIHEASDLLTILQTVKSVLLWGIAAYTQASPRVLIVDDISSSDLDFFSSLSDNENDRQDSFTRQVTLSGKVRSCALKCLFVIAKHQKKLFYEYWFNLLPPNTAHAIARTPFSGPHIISVLLFDPLPKVRCVAVTTLSALIAGSPLSKWVLPSSASQSKVSSKQPAFTSLSARTNDVVAALHSGLLQALMREKDESVVVLLLKCMSVLVSNTPYSQIVFPLQGLVFPLVEYALKLLQDSHIFDALPGSVLLPADIDATRNRPSNTEGALEIRQAVFLLVAETFGAPDSSLRELHRLLPAIDEKEAASHLDVIPIVLAHCRGVRAEPNAMVALRKIARGHPASLAMHWTRSESSVLSVLKESLLTVSLTAVNALKVIEEWIVVDASELIKQAMAIYAKQTAVSQPSLFWALPGSLVLLTETLPELYMNSIPKSDTSPSATEFLIQIRIGILACLANLPFSCWQQVTKHAALLQISLLAAHDQVLPIRVATCRCLASFAMYAGLHGAENEVDRDACVEELLALTDTEQQVAVRTRASWALANFCDTTLDLFKCLPRKLAEAVVVCAVKLADPTAVFRSPKIATNGIRAIGNISRWLPLSVRDETIWDLWHQLVTALTVELTTSTSLKCKWNACYALGNVFKNIHLPALLEQYPRSLDCMSAMFAALLLAVQSPNVQTRGSTSEVSNFKVRINAVTALSCPSSRAHYGVWYVRVLEAVVGSVSQAEGEPVTNYRELRYKATLRVCLIRTLVNLVLMAGPGRELESLWTKNVSVFAAIVRAERRRVALAPRCQTPSRHTRPEEDEEDREPGDAEPLTQEQVENFCSCLSGLYAGLSCAAQFEQEALLPSF